MFEKNREDYLRIMCELYEQQSDKKNGIKKTEIADRLKISKSSVTQMMKKFLDNKLIRMDFYSRIFFTKKGLVFAKQITRKYRIIEVFLKNILGYKSLKKITEEAHKMEHCFSDDSIERLDNYLGNPSKCPHGEDILE